VSFLINRIPRNEIPNLQNIPLTSDRYEKSIGSLGVAEEAKLVPDCTLPNTTFAESLLDGVLLLVFRGLVQKEIGWKSEENGIVGLLSEGRHFAFSPEGSEKNQHRFVKNVLAGLMTPVLPPFYRIFMAGLVPSKERGDPEWLVK
jgi:hypothetical protein